jgi:hypothetical protein
VFNPHTDIIYIGIKSFNESQNTYRIQPRCAGLGHHRQCLVGVPFSMILIAAALTGLERIRRPRWMGGTLAALSLHHAARATACAAGDRLPGDDLHDAYVRPDLCDDRRRAAGLGNVLPLISCQFSFQQFQFGIGAVIGCFASSSCSPWHCSTCAP